MNQPPDVPGWKRQEYSDLLAGLADFRSTEPLLALDAERAWDEGYPIGEVLHAANRAWAQNSIGLFRTILQNHAQDAYAKLHKLHDEGLLGG